MNNTPGIEDVKAALSHVMDPELGSDLVSLDMIRNIVVKGKTGTGHGVCHEKAHAINSEKIANPS